MSVVAIAIGASAYVGYEASKKGAEAIEKGAAAEERTAVKNLEFQREMEDVMREDFTPWREAGQVALDQIMEGIDTGAFEVGDIDVTKDPGYKFRMKEGMAQLEQSAAVRGRLLSDASRKDITGYAQDVASQEYANAYARESNEKARRFNILSGISGAGQASAARQAQATSQLAQTGGNIMATSGRAQQQAGVARAGAYQDTAQIINQAAQNWLTYRGAQPGTTAAPGTTAIPSNQMVG